MDLKANVSLLNGGNYIFWKTKIQAILVRDELWDVVSKPKPAVINEEWTKKNNKAKAYITLSVEDGQLMHIAHLEDAHSIWEVFSKKYERSTFGSRLYLRRKLYGIRYAGGKMSDHIDAIMRVVGLLRASGKPLEDDEVVAVLLVSLPESYSGLVTALEGRDEADLTIEYVTGKMLDEYQRRFENNEQNENEVAMWSNQRRNPKHTKPKKPYVNEGRTCFYCNKSGHVKADCYKYKSTLQKGKHAKSSVASTSQESITNEDNLSFEVCAEVRVECGSWYIDSGATIHMTNDKHFFNTIRNDNTKIYLANGSSVMSSGIGCGWLNCLVPNGDIRKILLKEVLYVPELDGGLLSVQRIANQGYKVIFEENVCQIHNGSQVVAQAKRSDSLYKLETEKSIELSCKADNSLCIHQWHRRLGHRDPVAIERLVKEDLATGIKLRKWGL